MPWFNFQPVNDMDRGREAMVYFHNSSIGFAKYRFSLDELISVVSKSNPAIFLSDFGFAINAIELSDSGVEDAMDGLAYYSQGSTPAQSQFFKALSDRKANLTFKDYVGGAPEIAGGMALDAVKGAQAVGDAVIDTGKSLLVVGPLLIVAAVIFIGYAKTRQIAGR